MKKFLLLILVLNYPVYSQNYPPQLLSKWVLHEISQNDKEVVIKDNGLYILNEETFAYDTQLDYPNIGFTNINQNEEIALSFLISAFEVVHIGKDSFACMSPEMELEFSSQRKFLNIIAMFLLFNKIDVNKAVTYGAMMKQLIILNGVF